MNKKALVVESTRLFQNLLSKTLTNFGIDCSVYSTGKEALEATHVYYDFIFIARTLKDTSADIFLQQYNIKFGLDDSLTGMLVNGSTDNENNDVNEAKKAGFKFIFSKDDLSQLKYTVQQALDHYTFEAKAKILFIEDSKSVGEAVVHLFNKVNAEVQHVCHLNDMKNIFSCHQFDLVIADYYLNDGETGDDVINYIRNYDDQDKASIPILIASGEANQSNRTAFLKNGANDFIIKPYDNDELLVRSSNLIKYYRLLRTTRDQKNQLAKMAFTDQLTGLYNRHALFNFGPKYLSNAKRHNDNLSLIIIDLDDFKQINDIHGHRIGDLVLKKIATTLLEICGTEDFLARFGGEEFVLFLTHSNLEIAANKAETLRKEIEACKPEELYVTASIGIAQLSDKDDINTLFDRADKAVYCAKKTGKNQVIGETLCTTRTAIALHV